MSLLFSLQFTCDGGCGRTKQTTGGYTQGQEMIDRILKEGWEFKGSKCYCPDCKFELDEKNRQRLEEGR